MRNTERIKRGGMGVGAWKYMATRARRVMIHGNNTRPNTRNWKMTPTERGVRALRGKPRAVVSFCVFRGCGWRWRDNSWADGLCRHSCWCFQFCQKSLVCLWVTRSVHIFLYCVNAVDDFISRRIKYSGIARNLNREPIPQYPKLGNDCRCEETMYFREHGSVKGTEYCLYAQLGMGTTGAH